MPAKWIPTSHARGLKHGYRSGLEEKIAAQIEGAGLEVAFEPFKVPYLIPETLHTYLLDFLLPNGIIVEGKGIFDAQDRAKHLLIKAQHPELDVRFVFSRLKAPITKGSKTTMKDWCEKHGFKCAEKLIPSGWFTETGPKRHPLEVIKFAPSAGAKRRKVC